MNSENNVDRRDFLKTVGAAGLGSILAAQSLAAAKEPNSTEPNKPAETKLPQVAKRKLGKTGAEVSELALGAMFNTVDYQLGLRRAVDWGVTYWDTAYSYANGNSEIGIGKFLAKNPEVRKNLFITSKASNAKTPEEIEEKLQTSLKRMNTEYIDLYYGIHGCTNPDKQLTPELAKWAEGAKKRKLIRYFGFSTDANMPKCLLAASKLDWIDAILTIYSVRFMSKPDMEEAVEACYKAGVGLTAMKVQAKGQTPMAEAEQKLFSHFVEKGFTEGQAKIKAVLQDKRFASACLGMESIAYLTTNVAAVLDKTTLAQADIDVLKLYAEQTCNNYCAGCTEICNQAVPESPYTNMVMRYLMYYNCYGQKDMARELFAQIPGDVRGKLLSLDYSLAEKRCPQGLPIARLMTEAVNKLA